MFSFNELKIGETEIAHSMKHLEAKCVELFIFLSSLKKCVVLAEIGSLQSAWNVNHATEWQIGASCAFHLNYRLGKRMLCYVGARANFPRVFFLCIFDSYWVGSLSMWPRWAASIFHQNSKNMPEMFSLAESMNVKHKSDGTSLPTDSISPFFPGERFMVTPYSCSMLFFSLVL